MPIPVAVAPAILTPGLYISVNLLSGAASPGQGVLKVLLLSPKSASGDLIVDSEIRVGGGTDSAGVAFGIGTPGHLAAKQLYTKYPSAQVYFGAPTAGATASTLNVTASGVPTGNNSVHWDIMGREFDVAWNSGETADTFKTRAITEINSRGSDLAVTASSGGVGIVTLTGKVTGNISKDILVKATLNLAATGTEAMAGALTATALSGGTTDATLTNILAAAAGTEFAYIAIVTSNTDAEVTAATSGPARVVTHINTYNSGLNASLQQAIVATTKTQANAKAAAIARNSPVLEQVHCTNARSLPGELVGREVGGRLAAESLDPSANRIGEYFDGIYASANPTADKPTSAISEDALGNGLSLVGYNAVGQPILLRPITTYSVDSGGAADRRLLDVQNVSATYAVVRDLRSALPQQFANAKIQKDSLPSDDPPPQGVTEERDIKAFVISRLRFWQREGVIQKATLDSVIASGELIVQVNASDSTQVDILIPLRIVQPLAKIGVVAQRRPG
jgi:phage tail sheath gpL-like